MGYPYTKIIKLLYLGIIQHMRRGVHVAMHQAIVTIHALGDKVIIWRL